MQETKTEEKATIENLINEIAEIKREYKSSNEEYKKTDEHITQYKSNIIDHRKHETENKKILTKANKDLDRQQSSNKDYKDQKATLEEDNRRADIEWNKLIR